MTRKILTSVAVAIATVWVIVTISFLMVRFMPGDPLMHLVGMDRYYQMLEDSPAELEMIAARYGLNDSLGQQYLSYLHSIATLDFGLAYSNNQPVLDNVMNRIGWTLVLSIPTFILGTLLGGWLGVLVGWKPGGRLDRIVTPFMLFLNTIPSNGLGILVLVVFAFRLRWFPVNGMTSGGLEGVARIVDIAWHATLPLTLMVLFRTAGNCLLMKSAVSQVRNEEYVVTAYSKGLSGRRVLARHVVKNAMLPFITSLSMQFGHLVMGSLILEVIFGWKGMGNLFFTAVNNRDFPTAQLCFLVTAVCIVVGNLIGDIAIALIDPRIKEDVGEYRRDDATAVGV
ncbi:MAG: ABC transporter permease [Propioniciclava sp.]|uniref:ABC transporter permease n=1 Tax=Propioniciclava sp. TaxID=2038686 RepID=UPI0039E315BA